VPRSRRFIHLGISLIAASVLALSVQGGRWWTIGPEVAIGPIGTIHCFGAAGAPGAPEAAGADDPGGGCQRGTLTWTGGSPLWMQAGTAVYAAGLIAAFALVALAAALAAKRTGRLAAGVTIVGAVTALAMGALFIATFPGVPGAVIGHGIWLFGGGLLAAGGIAITILRASGAAEGAGGAAPVAA
jgi:hypothetical protein